MTTAQNILLVYGVIILTYGFVLGIPLAAVRSRQPQASRHLVTTHLSGIIQGGVSLGLASPSAQPTSPPGWRRRRRS